MEDLLTPEQVAEMLAVPLRRLTAWRYNGEGPDYVKLGHRTVRYRRSDVEKWVDSQAMETAR